MMYSTGPITSSRADLSLTKFADDLAKKVLVPTASLRELFNKEHKLVESLEELVGRYHFARALCRPLLVLAVPPLFSLLRRIVDADPSRQGRIRILLDEPILAAETVAMAYSPIAFDSQGTERPSLGPRGVRLAGPCMTHVVEIVQESGQLTGSDVHGAGGSEAPATTPRDTNSAILAFQVELRTRRLGWVRAMVADPHPPPKTKRIQVQAALMGQLKLEATATILEDGADSDESSTWCKQLLEDLEDLGWRRRGASAVVSMTPASLVAGCRLKGIILECRLAGVPGFVRVHGYSTAGFLTAAL